MKINIDHITKVEGHGKLTIDVENKKVEKLQLEIFEGSRFFEAFMVDRRYDEAAEMASRICGICSYSHYLTALKASEAALKIKPSQQTEDIRRILAHAETVQSHVLHLYFLALADYLGYESIIALSKDHLDEVKRAFKLKKLSNDILSMIGGRSLQPVPNALGGFRALPNERQFEAMLGRVKEAKEDAMAMFDLFASLEYPGFDLDSEGLALVDGKEFAIYPGLEVASTKGGKFPVDKYQKNILETVVPYSAAKHSIHAATKESFYVGASARVNLQKDLLTDSTKEALNKIDVKFPNNNPYLNNLAQAVETIHCFDELERLLEQFSKGVKKEEPVKIKSTAGEGIAVTEAPRGTLVHHYRFNAKGRIEYANVITPTAMNLKRMEDDIRERVPQIIDQDQKEIVLDLEKLIRAYDPCISCATHFLDVKFV